MGLIDRVFGMLFGSGGNVIRDTAEVFIENRENTAVRAAGMRADALAQFAAEFGQHQRGWFDRALDGANRLPRPAMALGTLGLFTAAMVDPIWFASRMQGIALVPEPLWWLLAAIVSFYFGARHQMKHQQFQSQVAASLAMAPQVMQNLETLQAMRVEPPVTSPVEPALSAEDAQRAVSRGEFSDNAALRAWAATM